MWGKYPKSVQTPLSYIEPVIFLLPTKNRVMGIENFPHFYMEPSKCTSLRISTSPTMGMSIRICRGILCPIECVLQKNPASRASRCRFLIFTCVAQLIFGFTYLLRFHKTISQHGTLFDWSWKHFRKRKNCFCSITFEPCVYNWLKILPLFFFTQFLQNICIFKKKSKKPFARVRLFFTSSINVNWIKNLFRKSDYYEIRC